MASFGDYEVVVGIEIHAQLATQSKMFCSTSTAYGAGDNEHICEVCTAMPGALPTVNRKAIEFSARTGLALGCQIRTRSVFARKQYFYPDLPKGYQISQYDLPIAEHGKVDIELDGKRKSISIVRAHMEEDAGKSTHHGDYSLINLNRASTPLLEIVSGPDLRSPEEAAEYARTVHKILQYLEVCDGNLDEGSFRCDCNVSVRKKGESQFRTRVEIKNINSFRFVEKAVEFEALRQIDSYETGEKVEQETRLYDPDKNRTYRLRSKEEAHDYRYFPDPDLLPVVISQSWIDSLKAELPELPMARADRFIQHYGLPSYDALVLTQERSVADYFEAVVKSSGGEAKQASNWIMGDWMAARAEGPVNIKAEHLGQLIQLITKGTISGKIAKTVFQDMRQSDEAPEQIVQKKGLVQISDSSTIEKAIDDVMTRHPAEVEAYRGGKTKLFGFFVGQVMKATKGQANPEMVNTLIKAKLES